MEILTHHFLSTEDAYAAAQTDEGINDGDVLVIESEKVVGLVGDFPIAVTDWTGELHDLAAGDTLQTLGFNRESIAKAKAEAEHIGAALIQELSNGKAAELEEAEDEAVLEIMLQSVLEARESAERKAWDSLARYKFEMFGYWSSSWVKYNQLLPKHLRSGNVFKRAVDLARESRNELARRDA